MKQKLEMGARILLGLIYVIFGLNFFFQFIPMPPPPENMGALMGALMSTGYMMYLVKMIEIVCGALLIANLFVPLSMILLAPITINIFLIHLMMAPAGLGLAIPMVVLTAIVAWARWSQFQPVLKMKN